MARHGSRQSTFPAQHSPLILTSERLRVKFLGNYSKSGARSGTKQVCFNYYNLAENKYAKMLSSWEFYVSSNDPQTLVFDKIENLQESAQATQL